MPVDHVALYAALEALTFKYPALLEAYRKDQLPLLLEHMLALYGVKEIHGPESNPIINGWIRELNWQATLVNSDNSEWCTVPMALSWQRCGYPLPPHAPWSRSWAAVGVSVPAGQETIGDVVVLSRGLPEAQKGHVGVALKWEPEHVSVLGGNTADKVQDSWYPRGDKILAVRRPDPEWAKVAA